MSARAIAYPTARKGRSGRPETKRNMDKPTDTAMPMDKPFIIVVREMEPPVTSSHLLIQHCDSGLRPDNKIADDHAYRHQNPLPGKRGQLLSQIISGRHEPHVDACEKECQPDEGESMPTSILIIFFLRSFKKKIWKNRKKSSMGMRAKATSLAYSGNSRPKI